MKKVININFQGQVIAIEETAYEILKQYIESLKNYFAREEGGDEIVNDIENRIAELFGNRLKLGISIITDEDVRNIITNIGRPEDFDSDYEQASESYEKMHTKTQFSNTETKTESSHEEPRTLNRNSKDKIIAGVCSGVAHYFKIDPVWVRIIFVLLFSVLFWVYLILWIVLKPAELEMNTTKRLYRNPNDKIFGGVCGGIATYFKIESWIPRLIFAIPFFISLMGIVSVPFFPWNRIFDDFDPNWSVNFGVVVFYAVLWIIIPKAVTVKQKLEMMGEEAYVQSIREAVSENVASVKSKAETEEVKVVETSTYLASSQPDEFVETDLSPNLPPEPPKTTYKANTTYSNASERSGCLNAIAVFLKVIFFAFVGIFALALLSMLGVFTFAGTQLLPLKSLVIDGGLETTLMWLSIILLIGVPFIAIILWIVRRTMKAKSRPIIGVIATILWTIGIFTAITFGLKVAEKFKVESSVENTTTLVPIKSSKLYVEMLRYPSDYYTFDTAFGPGGEWDDLPYYTIDEDSLLFSDISLQIIESKDSLFHVNTISSAKAKDLKSAKVNVSEINYRVVQNDSILLLPEFFSVPIQQGFRVQTMVVEIAVPAGKKIEVSESLEDFERSVHSESLRRKFRKQNRYNQFLDYDTGEEYVLQNGLLKGTSLSVDSI